MEQVIIFVQHAKKIHEIVNNFLLHVHLLLIVAVSCRLSQKEEIIFLIAS